VWTTGVYASDLTCSGDTQKKAKLEFVAVAWDKNGKAAGNVSETMSLELKAETYQKILQTGFLPIRNSRWSRAATGYGWESWITQATRLERLRFRRL